MAAGISILKTPFLLVVPEQEGDIFPENTGSSIRSLQLSGLASYARLMVNCKSKVNSAVWFLIILHEYM